MDISKFQFAAKSLELENAQEGAKRTFKGVAYSGEVIEDHAWWGNLVFDLDTMSIKTPLAALIDHKSSQRVGVMREFNISNESGLSVSGDLLTNEEAKRFIQDSDDGFPWQMSVYIEPATIEKLDRGEVVVNGRTIQAPITIFRGGKIREVSFCAIGADSNTEAVAANLEQFNQAQPKEGTNVTELEQAQARISELEQNAVKVSKERDDALTALTQFKATQRGQSIKDLATELKTEFSAEDAKAYAEMSEEAYAFTATQLRKFSAKKLPDHLFNQQVGGGESKQFAAKSISDLAKARK